VALSIRWRLTLWNAAALAVVLTGFGGLTYALLRHALYEQTDRLLESALVQLRSDARLADDPADRLRHWVGEFKEHQDLFAVVYRADGSLVVRTEELAEEAVPLAPPDPSDRWIGDETLPTIGRQRELAGRLPTGGTEYRVVLLAPLAAVDRELAEVRGVLWVAGPAVLLAGAGLAYWLARKALAPMAELHRATDAVTADRLDRRLPVLNPSDELGRLTATVNAMIARLERSFAETRRFTADASHELRTPLAVIRAEAELALGRPLGQEELQQTLGSILEECDRLGRLTEQLLALARHDTGPADKHREPVRLPELLGGLMETLGPLVEAKGLALRFDPGPAADGVVVAGDPDQLRQVLLNMLDNAIKYTPAGGTIEVEVQPTAHDVQVRVRDTGEGIPAEHLPHVFERFYRVDKARSREMGGAGLGLSIAKSIVEAHGGRIELDSAPGGGTTCTVTLPLRTRGNGPFSEASAAEVRP
jgi:heavy metal sensor kinase